MVTIGSLVRSAAALAHHPVVGLVNLFPLLFLLRHGDCVAPALEVLQLRTKLPVAVKTRRIEDPLLEGGPHAATGLGFVLASAETALARKILDVGKRPIESGGPRLKLAHSGCVDHDAAARKKDQLPLCGCMPASIIVVPDFPNLEEMGACEVVDQRALSDTG